MNEAKVMPLTGQLYLHKKTGHIYRVLFADARIEATNTEAVIYTRADMDGGVVWVRPWTEFADGRFEHAAGQPKPSPSKEPHDWVPSTLGHGSSMCTKCSITDREAAALGMMNRCEP